MQIAATMAACISLFIYNLIAATMAVMSDTTNMSSRELLAVLSFRLTQQCKPLRIVHLYRGPPQICWDRQNCWAKIERKDKMADGRHPFGGLHPQAAIAGSKGGRLSTVSGHVANRWQRLADGLVQS